MFRAGAFQDKIGWDKRLPYEEFSYNNSYQACNTPGVTMVRAHLGTKDCELYGVKA
jgi:hypothetical protein